MDELSDDEKIILFGTIHPNLFNGTILSGYKVVVKRIMKVFLDQFGFPNIGHMIEFLGDDYHKALLVSYYIADDEYVPINELCDALWEAVKYKLRNETNS